MSVALRELAVTHRSNVPAQTTSVNCVLCTVYMHTSVCLCAYAVMFVLSVVRWLRLKLPFNLLGEHFH